MTTLMMRLYSTHNCMHIVPTGCNADRIKIDGVSVVEGTASVQFSSDPNTRFRCRLNHRRYRRFRKCKGSEYVSELLVLNILII